MMMKAILLVMLVPATAWPCQPRPPSHQQLVLLTAAGATLPADGAILVTRRELPGETDDEDAWTVEDGTGKRVEITAEDLGSDLERWVPASPADRDLVIRNAKHAVVATLHQTSQHPAALAAPSVRGMRSSVVPKDLHMPQGGVPDASTKLELGKDLPASARYVTIAIAGTGAHAHSAVAAGARTFEATTYAHKSCADVGPGPIAVGQRVSITWVDDLGRRSPATTAAVAKL